ncbi:hypothetical protein LEN26_010983 [Aphanomyces euteiches]|nr:hypothetical protein LEN26_010983 [Aphanomyces euteiches]KAH9128877.1 hypothetical protein AeMF1_001007 [Aphanomyces euteiches]KAH9196338.1 hypothetical protein AeNC1_001692 [Aphanomyces euteiches]
MDSLHRLRDELAATFAREATIQASLEEYASMNALQNGSEQQRLKQRTRDLLQYKQQGGIDILRRQTGQIGLAIASANDVAEKMTREVRKLGKTQERLKACIERSDGMIRVRQSMQRLKASMATKNYKDAAGCLQELREIEAMHIPLDVSDTLRMNNAESDIRYAIESQMEAALRNHDEATILRVGAIFEPMRFAEEGVQMVLHFLERNLRERLDGIQGPPNAVWSVPELTSHLVQAFNAVAETIQRYDPLLVQSFSTVHGAERMLASAYSIGTPVAVHILTAYIKQRGLADLLAKAKQGGKSSKNPPASPSKREEESLDLHPYLNELVVIIQHSQTYERFMRSREAQYVSKSTGSPSTKAWLPSYNASNLNQCVQDLAGYYCSLEEQCLLIAARKASALEELRSIVLDDQLIPVSSIVDEVFYIARHSGSRSLASGHVDSASGVLTVLATLVQSTVGNIFKARVAAMAKEGQGGALSMLGTLTPKQLRDQVQHIQVSIGKKMVTASIPTPPTSNPKSTPSSATPTAVMMVMAPPVTLNSIDAAVQYLAQLQQTFESEMTAAFPDRPPRLAACLLGLEETASEFKALLLTCLDTVCEAMIQPKVTSTCAPLLKKASYELTDAMFTANEANDPYVLALIQAVDSVVAPFESHLSRANFAQLMEAAGDIAVALVENMITTKSFNPLGAMQLEKEVRLLLAHFGSKCDHSKRHHDSFAALRQISMVLTVDTPDDVLEFIGRPTKGVPWKLSRQRVVDLLHLRVDFTTAAVLAVKLEG